VSCDNLYSAERLQKAQKKENMDMRSYLSMRARASGEISGHPPKKAARRLV